MKEMVIKGSEIKKAIKMAGKTIAEVAVSIGITREHLGRILAEDVSDVYIQKIINAGIKINVDEIKNDIIDPVLAQNMQLTIDYLKHRIQTLEEINKTLTRLINSELDNGAVFIQRNKEKTK